MADDRVRYREMFLVAAVALVQIGGPILTAQHQPERDLPLTGFALLALGVAAVPLRLARPVTALALSFSATLAYSSLGYALGPIFPSLLITFGNAVLQGHRRAAVASLIAGYLGFNWLGFALGREAPPSVASASGLAAWLLVLYTACELIRVRRDRARDQAQAKADALQRQVANERLAIARELHDVVAHNMSLIHMQAGVALHLNDDLPAPARDALETIKAASKDALIELRSILGVLRHADEDASAPRAPAPSLAALADLATRAEAAGAEVTAHVDVDPDDLPRAVDLAAYRIVQEALTNVARHADPPVASVTVRRDNDVLVVAVVDAGTGRRRADALPSGGNGIPGMRERAASVGGTLVAGPRLGAGFSVEARLPLEHDTVRAGIE